MADSGVTVIGLAEAVHYFTELGGRILGQGCRAAADAIAPLAAADWAAGKGPFGQAWKPRKEDGAVALRRPVSAIRWVAKRGAIVALAEDVILYHRGRRPVFPVGSQLPPAWLAAMEAALVRVIEKGAPK